MNLLQASLFSTMAEAALDRETPENAEDGFQASTLEVGSADVLYCTHAVGACHCCKCK